MDWVLLLLLILTPATHHQLCSLASLGVSAIYHYTPSAVSAHCRRIKPRCVSHGGKRQPIQYCFLPLQPQLGAVSFSVGGELFNYLSLGLPSDAHLLEQHCGGPCHKAHTAHFHQTHHNLPSTSLCLCC